LSYRLTSLSAGQSPRRSNPDPRIVSAGDPLTDNVTLGICKCSCGFNWGTLSADAAYPAVCARRRQAPDPPSAVNLAKLRVESRCVGSSG